MFFFGRDQQMLLVSQYSSQSLTNLVDCYNKTRFVELLVVICQ